MRLTSAIERAVKRAGVHVKQIDRTVAAMWDNGRSPGDPLTFCGWYWDRTHRGKVVETDRQGPFPCYSAAVQDAFVSLQLSAQTKR
jgi:hypothetical protein